MHDAVVVHTMVEYAVVRVAGLYAAMVFLARRVSAMLPDHPVRAKLGRR